MRWPRRKSAETFTELVAYRCTPDGLSRLESMPEAELPSSSQPLAPGLLQAPGLIRILEQGYDLSQDGVYRFYRLPVLSEQRLVCTGGLDMALNLLGYLWVYGNQDDRLSPRRWRAAISARCLVMSCGYLAQVACALLTELGFGARRVSVFTSEPWTGQDDGHTLLEVRAPGGQWFLYDPSFQVLFERHGRRIDLLAWVSDPGSASLRRLTGNQQSGSFVSQGYDYGFWVAERLLDPEALSRWYARMAQIPLVHTDRGLCYPRLPLAHAAADRLKIYEAMDPEAFIHRFYSDTSGLVYPEQPQGGAH